MKTDMIVVSVEKLPKLPSSLLSKMWRLQTKFHPRIDNPVMWHRLVATRGTRTVVLLCRHHFSLTSNDDFLIWSFFQRTAGGSVLKVKRVEDEFMLSLWWRLEGDIMLQQAGVWASLSSSVSVAVAGRRYTCVGFLSYGASAADRTVLLQVSQIGDCISGGIAITSQPQGWWFKS